MLKNSPKTPLSFQTDKHGFLKDSSEWNYDIANIIASQENINLTKES